MNNRFVNPYNFISFPKEKAQKYSDSDRHTGVIEYTLTTKSPLFIPNSSNDNAFGSTVKDHKTYDFYSYTDLSCIENVSKIYHEPVIPGSEVRGMIRSVYETLTDSCMGLLNDTYPIKRISASFEPGLLHKRGDKLELFNAISYRIDGWKSIVEFKQHNEKINESYFADRKDGHKLVFPKPIKLQETRKNGKKFYYDNKVGYENNNGNILIEGYLIKWDFGAFKKNYHIFVKDASKPRPIEENMKIKDVIDGVYDVVQSYLDILKLSEKEKEKEKEKENHPYNAYRKAFDEFINCQCDTYFPINYAKVGDNLYLTPSTYSREISKNSIGDLTIFKPCVNDCCPACDLFGRVGNNAKSSSIRFSDLKVKEKTNLKDYYYECGECDEHDKTKVTLSNLNSPKLSNVDFYLIKPDGAKYWSYDYFVTRECVKLEKGQLRGRKYYWHSTNVELNNIIECTNQNKTIRPVKEGVSFSGELYFDGISEKQLKQLIYILNISKYDEMGFKLGMGKPLGLGSVALKVDKLKVREISYKNNEVSYVETENEDYRFKDGLTLENINYDNAELSRSVKTEFETITKFNAVKNYDVCYPKTKDNETEGFKWFISNRKQGLLKKKEEMEIYRSLPYITDEDISLPYYPNDNHNSSIHNGCNYSEKKSNDRKNFKKEGDNKRSKFNNGHKGNYGSNAYRGNNKHWR